MDAIWKLGVTSLYGLNKYVLPQRAQSLSRIGQKWGLGFAFWSQIGYGFYSFFEEAAFLSSSIRP